jgi:type II secretory pathway component PulK
MTNRRGAALLMALWLVVAAATLGAAAMSGVRLAARASGNRLDLERAARARDACIAILAGRFDHEHPLRGLGRTAIGERVWCAAGVTDPSTRLDVNRATVRQLSTVLGSDSLAEAIADWRDADADSMPSGAEAEWYRRHHRAGPANRPIESLDELRYVRGFESLEITSLGKLLTVEGRGRINVMGADPRVLAALPGLNTADIPSLTMAVEAGRSASSVTDLVNWLGGERGKELARVLPELAASVAFGPSELVIEAVGGVEGSAIEAHARLLAVPLPERLAIVRRVVW